MTQNIEQRGPTKLIIFGLMLLANNNSAQKHLVVGKNHPSLSELQVNTYTAVQSLATITFLKLLKEFPPKLCSFD